MDEVRRRVEEFMAKFNEDSRALKMELVLFKGEAGWKRGKDTALKMGFRSRV